MYSFILGASLLLNAMWSCIGIGCFLNQSSGLEWSSSRGIAIFTLPVNLIGCKIGFLLFYALNEADGGPDETSLNLIFGSLGLYIAVDVIKVDWL